MPDGGERQEARGKGGVEVGRQADWLSWVLSYLYPYFSSLAVWIEWMVWVSN